jgi:Glycosyltransferase Family 4
VGGGMTIKPCILAVSYAYPPLKWPRAVQVHRLLNGLAELGHPITLFRAEPASAFGAVDTSMKNLDLHPGIEIVSINAFHRNPAIRIVNKLFPWLKQLPDEFNAWILPAYLTIAKRIRQGSGSQVLCTFSNPWSDHLIGARLQRKFGLPWVAHFSDPWAFNPFFQRSPRLQRFHEAMEKKVVDGAKRLVFVSEETRSLFIHHYADLARGKSLVVPHIMAPELARLRARKKKNRKLTFTYTGEFYGPRTPEYLFRALSALIAENPAVASGIQVRLVGNMQPEYQKLAGEPGLRDVVSLVNTVPYRESLDHIVEADVLLLIDAQSEGESVFLPSKLVEYLGSGNPILGLTPARGTSARMIQKANGLVADPADVEGIKRCFSQLWNEHAAGALASARAYGQEIVDEYTQRSAAQRFAEAVAEAEDGQLSHLKENENARNNDKLVRIQ